MKTKFFTVFFKGDHALTKVIDDFDVYFCSVSWSKCSLYAETILDKEEIETLLKNGGCDNFVIFEHEKEESKCFIAPEIKESVRKIFLN